MGKIRARLSSITIRKFRSINNSTIRFEKETALVGQNSSGKSAILRALNCIFNYEQEKADLQNGSHKYSPNSQSVIEVSIQGLQPVKDLPKEYFVNDTHSIRLKYRKRTVWEVKTSHGWVNIEKNIALYNKALRKQIDFYLIPVRRDYTVTHDPSLKLLDEVIESWLEKNRKRDRISPRIMDIGSDFRKSLDKLEASLGSYSPESWPFDIHFAFHTEPNFKLFLPGLGLEVSETDNTVPIQDSGSGTQSLAIFSLYASLANLNEAQIVLGFEEPELNLHPHAQRQLIDHLRTYNLQLIFTTHSHTIVDSVEHKSIVLCQKSHNANGRPETNISQLRQDFPACFGLREDKYEKFHRRNNSSFIFASCVLIVESPIDAEVIRMILSENGIDLHTKGISLVSLGGVESLSYMYFLLRELEIPSWFVVDKDFFVPYENNRREDSLNGQMLPKYGTTLNSNLVVNDIFHDEDAETRRQFAINCSENHTAVLNFLEHHCFISFRYDLETDLLCATYPRKKILKVLNADSSLDKSAEDVFLYEKRKLRKNEHVLLEAVEGAKRTQLPNSYKRIIKAIEGF